MANECKGEFKIAKKLLLKSKVGDKIGFACGKKHYQLVRNE